MRVKLKGFNLCSILISLFLYIPLKINLIPSYANIDEKESIFSNNPIYVLGPGDQITIKIYQFDKFNTNVKLMPDGYVNLPRVGSIYLNGLTITEAKNKITHQYSKILKNPLIYVDLIDARPISFSIFGEVKSPGIYFVSNSDLDITSKLSEAGSRKNFGWPTVVDAIQKSGGLKSNADLRKIVLKRFSKDNSNVLEINIDLWDIFANGNLKNNLRIFDGDSLIVNKANLMNSEEIVLISESNLSPSNVNVTVIGEVNNPGKITIKANSPINVAILNSGGFTKNAKKSNINILRLKNNTITNRKFNFLDRTALDGSKFFLKDEDVIVVDKNNLARISNTLNTVVEPINPIISAASLYKLLFDN